MTVDQATNSLAERAALSRERVEQLRLEARRLGDLLTRGAIRLRECGRPVPAEWTNDYSAWADDVEQLIDSWAAESAFASYRPGSDAGDDLTLWNQALARFQHDQEVAQAERLRHIAERREMLEHVLDLHCTTGTSTGLNELQQHARRCRDVLEAAIQATDTTSVTHAVEDESRSYSLFEALWSLVCNAHGRVSGDDQSSVDHGELLREACGLELVMKVCLGQIVPRNGWPLQPSERNDVGGADGTPPRSVAPNPSVPESNGAAAADVVDSEEALARLKWAQPPDAAPLEPRPPATVPKPINRLELDSLRSRVRSAADSARHIAEVEGDRTHRDLADGFDALHSAICYTLSVLSDRSADDASSEMSAWRTEFHSALQSIATSQSALRKFHIDQGWTPCAEQDDTFCWLKVATDHPDACYLDHMKLDEPADPAEMPELKRRVDAARHRWERPKRQQKLAKKIQYEIGRMTRDVEADRPHWETIVSTVDHLLTEENVQPSNTDLRKILLPHYDEFPDDLDVPNSFQSVLRAIDEYQANCEAEAARQEVQKDAPSVSPQVAEVARLLQGKKLVMVGGVRKESARQRIEQSLGLSAFDWLETSEHESTEKFRPLLSGPDVYLVCLLVRWCGHHHIDSLKEFCRVAGKHCVVMPRGYNLERVAHDVLDQCGDRLREEQSE